MRNEFPIPPIIADKYNELYDLVQNKSQNGILLPTQIASYLNKDLQWLLHTTYSGMCPFGFGSDKGVRRGTSCFHVLPFFFYQTQGAFARAIPDHEETQQRILA